MSKKELTRLEVIQKIEEKRLKQREAAERLRVSERQVRRLLKAYRQSEAVGLVSKRRGQPSNNRMKMELPGNPRLTGMQSRSGSARYTSSTSQSPITQRKKVQLAIANCLSL